MQLSLLINHHFISLLRGFVERLHIPLVRTDDSQALRLVIDVYTEFVSELPHRVVFVRSIFSKPGPCVFPRRVAIREKFNSPNQGDDDRAGKLSTGFEFAKFPRLNRKPRGAVSSFHLLDAGAALVPSVGHWNQPPFFLRLSF